jgi:hypothetical protein
MLQGRERKEVDTLLAYAKKIGASKAVEKMSPLQLTRLHDLLLKERYLFRPEADLLEVIAVKLNVDLHWSHIDILADAYGEAVGWQEGRGSHRAFSEKHELPVKGKRKENLVRLAEAPEVLQVA